MYQLIYLMSRPLEYFPLNSLLFDLRFKAVFSDTFNIHDKCNIFIEQSDFDSDLFHFFFSWNAFSYLLHTFMKNTKDRNLCIVPVYCMITLQGILV